MFQTTKYARLRAPVSRTTTRDLEDEAVDIIDISVRSELPGDAEHVHDLHHRAFGSGAESALVSRLRSTSSPHVSLVALVNHAIAGHIFFSPVTVERSAPNVRCLGLGPMAVLPEIQGRGVGTALVEYGLLECQNLGAAAVFVLGHPDYYPRFGFLPASPLGFHYKSPRYDPYFFVLELLDGFVRSSSGVVTYNEAFDQS